MTFARAARAPKLERRFGHNNLPKTFARSGQNVFEVNAVPHLAPPMEFGFRCPVAKAIAAVKFYPYCQNFILIVKNLSLLSKFYPYCQFLSPFSKKSPYCQNISSLSKNVSVVENWGLHCLDLGQDVSVSAICVRAFPLARFVSSHICHIF